MDCYWILFLGFIGGVIVDTVYEALPDTLPFWGRMSVFVTGYVLVVLVAYVLVGLITGDWTLGSVP